MQTTTIDAGRARRGARIGAALAALLAASPALALAQRGAQGGAAHTETLIRNATVMTVTHGTIENGSVLIRDGKIAAVGTDVKASPSATVVDGTGKFVTPGIVDCHSHIAVSGDVNEGSLSVTSMVRIGDVIDPDDSSIFYDLAGGVTAANILHGSANPIGGQNQVIKLRWGKRAEELKFAGAPPGIKFALGENVKQSNFTFPPNVPRRYPATRMGVEETIRDAFSRARDYKAEWDAYEAGVKAGKKDLVPPRRSLELDPLVEVLEGKRLVHCHCYTADEILMLVRVSKDFGFHIATFQHVLEGYKIADVLASEHIGASTFADLWAYKIEAFDAIPYNAALMWKAGVNVSVNSDDAERARRLNLEAARVVRYGGVPRDEAFKMVTINPAEQLGIDKWVGSLDVGKDGDVVVWSADPLSSYAVAEKVFIDGQQYFDRADAIRRAEVDRQEKLRLGGSDKAPKETKTALPPKPADTPNKDTPKNPTGGAR